DDLWCPASCLDPPTADDALLPSQPVRRQPGGLVLHSGAARRRAVTTGRGREASALAAARAAMSAGPLPANAAELAPWPVNATQSVASPAAKGEAVATAP